MDGKITISPPRRGKGWVKTKIKNKTQIHGNQGFQSSPKEVKGMTTEELRSNFLVQQLMQDGKINLMYSHYDRVIVGGVKPTKKRSLLPNEAELRANYFSGKRESFS